MSTPDYFVILLYVIGLIAMGASFISRNKSSQEMFAAGGQSPWWVSGLSAFMTMFSAGTFVVWGGIAYRYGFVAVAISLCYGVAALIVGATLAGVWKRIGVNSAAEFLQLRFGNSIVQFYTWLQGLINLFTMGGSVYALSVIVCTLVPLGIDHPLADPATGNLSVTYTSIFICGVVILITFGGGLWAVLMTDVLQFIILTVSVIVVVPLILMQAGGLGSMLTEAPEGFWQPVAQDYTWWFLTGWVVVHYFKIGGDWTFVQRFLCVPTEKDARKSTYLFGIMYLVSPIFWMLPPMAYRLVSPIPEGLSPSEVNALGERAYILACQQVLPVGMMGLMVAAMTSATASMVTTQLNVYAGAFTNEFYRNLINPQASEKRLVAMGRIFTVALGMMIVAGAMIIPRAGTYTGYIISLTAMLTGPLVLPTIWGLFSRKISLKTAWAATIIGGSAAVVAKFGLSAGGFLDVELLRPITSLVQHNQNVTDLVVGSVTALLVLGLSEALGREEAPGYRKIQAHAAQAKVLAADNPIVASLLPAKLCAWSVLVLGAVMTVLAVTVAQKVAVLLTFAAMLFLLGGAIWYGVRRVEGRVVAA
ncbi:MAG: sodium:solute symporter family protein [Verrucomicrobiota bacterium JB022]|nr:sodium:solute symporter family protein [Verrucomicrobiota bacterium JB022]